MARRKQYDRTHEAVSVALRLKHVALHGWVCPGLDGIVELHPVRAGDLVADHNVAGHPEHGYTVRCDSCNSKRIRLLGQ